VEFFKKLQQESFLGLILAHTEVDPCAHLGRPDDQTPSGFSMGTSMSIRDPDQSALSASHQEAFQQIRRVVDILQHKGKAHKMYDIYLLTKALAVLHKNHCNTWA